MDYRLDELRKSLPVDIKESYGICSRGYVQDVLENGDFLVHFDRKINPMQAISAGLVLDAHRPESEDCHFHSGSDIEVLLRLTPADSERWYPASITEHLTGVSQIISVSLPGGVARERLLKSNEPTFARASDDAKQVVALFRKLRRDIPTEMERAMQCHPNFLDKWQRSTRSLVVSIEDGTPLRSMCVVASSGSVVADSGKNTRSGQKRLIELLDVALWYIEDGRYEVGFVGPSKLVRSRYDGDSSTVCDSPDSDDSDLLDEKMEFGDFPSSQAGSSELIEYAYSALSVPEILGKICLYMDGETRDDLCTAVPGIASLKTDASYGCSGRLFHRKVLFLQCFTRHLTSLTVSSPKPYGELGRLDTFLRYALKHRPHALKKLVFIDVSISCPYLVAFFNLRLALLMVFRKCRVTHISRSGATRTGFDVTVDADQFQTVLVLPNHQDKEIPVPAWPAFFRNDPLRMRAVDQVLTFLGTVLARCPVTPADADTIRKLLNPPPVSDSDDSSSSEDAVDYSDAVADILKRFDPHFYQPGKKDYRDLDLARLRPVTLHFLKNANKF